MPMVIIPNLYRKEILPAKEIENNWQWSYFLSGTATLMPAFIPLVNHIDRNSKNNNGSACGGGCGSGLGASGCGGSCGGGCGGGGCGGD